MQQRLLPLTISFLLFNLHTTKADCRLLILLNSIIMLVRPVALVRRRDWFGQAHIQLLTAFRCPVHCRSVADVQYGCSWLHGRMVLFGNGVQLHHCPLVLARPLANRVSFSRVTDEVKEDWSLIMGCQLVGGHIYDFITRTVVNATSKLLYWVSERPVVCFVWAIANCHQCVTSVEEH